MAIEIQPEEYDAAALNRSLQAIQTDLNRVKGLIGDLGRESLTFSIPSGETTIEITVTLFDGTTKTLVTPLPIA